MHSIPQVCGRLGSPRLEGARAVLPSEVQVEVELWRADLMAGVLEVDPQGNVGGGGAWWWCGAWG